MYTIHVRTEANKLRNSQAPPTASLLRGTNKAGKLESADLLENIGPDTKKVNPVPCYSFIAEGQTATA